MTSRPVGLRLDNAITLFRCGAHFTAHLSPNGCSLRAARSLMPDRQAMRLCAAMAMMGVGLFGCGDDEQLVSCAPSVEGAPCERWRSSICRFASNCGIEVDDCLAQYGQFDCRSEDLATRCADAFLSASCDSPPVNCDFEAVAYVEPAVSGCERYLDETCHSAVTCQIISDQEQCLADVDIDCSTAVALGDSYDACLSSLRDLDCAAWVLPESCRGAVIVLGRQSIVASVQSKSQ